MGSKSKIADDIMAIMPRGKRFVDLCGGGGAMTHCAALSGKYEEVYYNELNPLVADCFRKAIAGDYKNETRWISREDFKRLKDVDGYVRLCWSFGNNGQDYMYSAEIEPWKKALHYARVFNDYSLLKEFGINSTGTRQDITAHKEEYKEKYIKWYLKNICLSDADFDKLKNKVTKKIKEQKDKLRLYLCDSLKKSGLTAADVDRRLGTQMSGHYFGRSQWAFPTREYYNKMREFMPLKPYDEVYGFQELLQSLQSLANIGKIQINCGSYMDYEYKHGDVVFCFDDETELLTKRGWINVSQIKEDDLFLSREPNTSNLEYVKNTQKIEIDYNGFMYNYEGKNISINVSENHNLFVNIKKGRNKKREDVTIKANEAYKKNFQFISAGGIWKGTPEKTIKILGIEYDKIKFARLLGIFLTDGSINKQENIFINQTKENIRNIIRNLLIDLNIDFTEGEKYFYLSRKYKEYFKQFYLKENRRIPEDFKNSNIDVLRALLDGIIDGDGDNSRRRIYIGSKNLVDDIQEIIYKIGLSSCFYIKEPKQSYLAEEKRYIKATKPYYVVSINHKEYLNHFHKNEKRVKYKGKLYCCLLEKWHTVLMRRHGKIIWINQCDPPYENTSEYSEDGFNHKEFYDWVYSRSYQVYFSSYEISDTRFYKIWSKEKTQLLNGQGAGKKKQETIYSNRPDKVMLF